MAEQNSPEYPPALDLERELTRKERQIEYLQTELRRYHNLMEELKQGMRPIGTIEEVKGDMALVRLSGGQAFQVSIPPEIREKVSTEVDAVLSPTKGVIVDVIERLRERSLLEYQVEKSPKVFYEDVVGLEKELLSLRQAVEWILGWVHTLVRSSGNWQDVHGEGDCGDYRAEGSRDQFLENRELRDSVEVAGRVGEECQRGLQARSGVSSNSPLHR